MRQWAEDERHTGRTDLLGQAEKVTFSALFAAVLAAFGALARQPGGQDALAPDSAAVGFAGSTPDGARDYVTAVRPQPDAWASNVVLKRDPTAT